MTPFTFRRPRPSKRPLGGPFWLVWAAATVSFAGDGIYNGAVPLLAAQMTRDPAAISLTTVCSRIGWLVLGLLSGALVDRWSKTQVMWRADLVRGVAVAVFTGLVVSGRPSMAALYTVSLLMGCMSPFFDNASSALLPRLVPTAALERANSWNQTSLLAGAMLVGPPLGAVLFTWHSGVPLAVEAGSFAVSALLLAVVRSRLRASGDLPAVVTSRRSLRRELSEGLRYLARHRLLRTLALLLAALNAATGAVLSLLVLYALQVLGYPQAAYGWLVTVFAVGGLAGTILVRHLQTRLGSFAAVLSAAVAVTTGTLLLGLVPQLPFVVAGIVVSGVGSSLWNVTVVSLRQRIVPAGLLGRVNGVFRMVGMGAMPAGAAAGGGIAHVTGVQGAYVAAGLLLVVATAAAAWPLRCGLRELAQASVER